MPLQPDHPDFTAAVFGEAPPEELAAFEAGLAENAEWLAEAGTLRETAGRLAAALRQEQSSAAATGLLTSGQRQAVFSAGADSQRKIASVTLPHFGTPPVFPATFRPVPSRRAAGRVLSRFGPALATAGVAAAVVLGIFALSGPQGTQNPQSSIGGNPKSGQVPEGIPAITLDPTATAQKSGAPAPGLPTISKKNPVLNPGSPLAVPPGGPDSESIATSAPDIQIIPAPPGKARSSEPASEPVPGTRRSGGVTGTLASPVNPGGR